MTQLHVSDSNTLLYVLLRHCCVCACSLADVHAISLVCCSVFAALEALGVSITADLLPVIDPDGALEQCGDWSFVVELLNDLLTEKPDILNGLSSALAASDHVAFHKTAHALKGAALNLHLPALSDVSKKAELLGKALEKTPSDAVMLPHRAVLLHRLQSEYARLEAMLPELQLKAQQEQAELAAAGALE